MPKHWKRKAKPAGKPLAVLSLDNKPRYTTPEVHQLPTLEPTPAIKARNRMSTVDVNDPLARITKVLADLEMVCEDRRN